MTVLAILGCSVLAGAAFLSRPLADKKADPSLMFLTTFDTRSVTADVARGEPKSFTLPNLDLSLRGCVGFDGEQAFMPETGETLKYPGKGNFNPHRGTVVFWGRGDVYDPQDENVDGKPRGNVVLAQLMARDGNRWIGYTFYTYRNIFFGVWSNHVKASVGSQGIVQGRLLGIRKGDWYQIAVTWDDEKLTYYLNGRRVGSSPLPEKKEFSADVLPGDGPDSFIAVKPVLYEDDNSLTTSVDDFAIYDRPLSPIEINNAYFAVAKDRRGRERKILSISVRGAATDPKGPADRLVAEIDGSGLDLTRGPVRATWSLVGPDAISRTGTWMLDRKETDCFIDGVTSVGDHTLTVTVGKSSATTRFTRPDLSWVGNDIADEDEVPPLWKDFAVNGRTVALWNRSYRFDNGPLPVSIRAFGRELLARSPRLLVDGCEPTWTAGPTERRNRLVVFTGSGTVGRATVDYRTAVEFDGLVKFDWTVRGRPEISSMCLDWQVEPVVAEFLLTPKVCEGDAKVSFPFPRSVSHPKMLWFASEGHGGFAWTAITDANWVSEKGADVIFADRATGACRVEMITRKTQMPDDVSYGALFIATPTRPLTVRKRLIRHAAQTKGGVRFMNAGAEPAVDSCFTHAPRDEFDIFNRTVSNCPPDSICLYGAAQSFSEDLPMARFLEKYLMMPGVYRYTMPTSRIQFDGTRKDGTTKSIPVCSNAFANDYSFWCDAKLWSHANNDRVAYTYFDLCECMPCRNREHGCGHVDCFGREVATFTTLGMREFVRRITILAHRNGREVILHAQRDFLPFVEGLTDYWYPGEQHNGDILANRWAYTDAIPDVVWRSEFNRDVLGVGIIQAPVFGQNPRTKDVRFKPEYTESMLAAVLPYDIESGWAYTDPSVMEKVCKVFERLGLASPETVCHKFYWQAEVKSSDPDVRVTWYELPKDVKLLVVANKTPQTKSVTLDVTALGRDFEVCEEYRDAKVSCADGLVRLDVPSRNFQLVTLRRRP